MANTVLPFTAPAAKLTRADLVTIHAVYVERINAAMIRAQRTADVPGAPASLWDAGLFLAAQGFDALECAGETYFGLGFASYRSFLDGMGANGRTAAIEAGRKVIFGTARRAGLIASVAAQRVAA